MLALKSALKGYGYKGSDDAAEVESTPVSELGSGTRGCYFTKAFDAEELSADSLAVLRTTLDERLRA